jgi:hypothetical protein
MVHKNKKFLVGSCSVKLILIPCVDTVYSGINLNMFLVIYNEVH